MILSSHIFNMGHRSEVAPAIIEGVSVDMINHQTGRLPQKQTVEENPASFDIALDVRASKLDASFRVPYSEPLELFHQLNVSLVHNEFMAGWCSYLDSIECFSLPSAATIVDPPMLCGEIISDLVDLYEPSFLFLGELIQPVHDNSLRGNITRVGGEFTFGKGEGCKLFTRITSQIG